MLQYLRLICVTDKRYLGINMVTGEQFSALLEYPPVAHLGDPGVPLIFNTHMGYSHEELYNLLPNNVKADIQRLEDNYAYDEVLHLAPLGQGP